MRATRILLPCAATLALLLAPQPAPEAAASNRIAEREGLACTSCHDKPGSKLLTDRGKYYELMLSLEGYDELQSTFGRCTACHARKPGSLKLTRKGRQFRWMLDDMEGLRELLLGHHPGLLEEIESSGEPPEAADGRGSPAAGSEPAAAGGAG